MTMHNLEMRTRLKAAVTEDAPWIPWAQNDLMTAADGFVDRALAINTALRRVHTEEQFGDCVEDGDPYPCQTIQLLDGMDA
jgi:hypothetical protein